MSTPMLAIVGHPNRGKSSLVATLIEEEGVAISPVSGTTEVSEPFSLSLAGETYLTLVDTPGFQRARRLLAALGGSERPLAERPEAIRQFLADPQQCRQFPDEAALLRPIVEGAGVLYVVDGARPVEDIYTAEMELLRWTGAPRMAVINPIGDDTYVSQWQAVLNQQFQVVRVFNPLTSGFSTRLKLLQAFAVLAPQWASALERLNQSLAAAREERRLESAALIARMLKQALSHSVVMISQSETAKRQAQGRLLAAIEGFEQQCWQAIGEVYRFAALDWQASQITLGQEALFDQDTWQQMGLSNRQLLLAASASGAIAGGAVDVAVGGSSLFLGSLAGAGLAGAGAWWANQKLSGLKWLNKLVDSKQTWRCGPVQHANFGFVLTARALAFWFLVEQRTHAQRDALSLPDMQAQLWRQLTVREQGQLLKRFQALRKGQSDERNQAQLSMFLLEVFERMNQSDAND